MHQRVTNYPGLAEVSGMQEYQCSDWTSARQINMYSSPSMHVNYGYKKNTFITNLEGHADQVRGCLGFLL